MRCATWSANSGRASSANLVSNAVEREAVDTARMVESLERQLQETSVALEQARQELAERERLALIGQIAVAISHELRQPLSVINNIAYYLHLVCGEKDAPDAYASLRPHLDKLEDQVALANRIVSNLTEYARTQQPNRQPTDLNHLVEEQMALVEIPESIRVEKQLGPGLPRALADPVHVERVLHNLLTNAIQSMRASGGELRLRTFVEDLQVVLEVGDTGPGIPEELRDKIFQPFFSTKFGGLGLGLALARQLLEANQGSISFCTRPDRGATFQVRLPAAKQ